jgi:hypothetical protein
MIALFFIEPFIRPSGRRALLLAGIAACLLLIPLAMFCGAIREIPV